MRGVSRAPEVGELRRHDGVEQPAVLQHDHGMADAFGQGQGLAAGQRMVGPHQRADRGGKLGDHVDAAMPVVDEQHAEIVVTRTQRLADLAGMHGQHGEAHLGMPGRHLVDRLRQEAYQERLERDDADVARHRATQAGDLRPRALVFVLRLAHVAQQQLAGRRRAHAAPAALEQGHPHLVFQAQDLPVDRRGGDAQRIGGLADRAVARDMVEIAQDRGMHDDVPLPQAMPKWQRTARINVLF